MRMHAKNGGLKIDLDQILSGHTPLNAYMRYTDYASLIRRWKSMVGEGRFRAMAYDRIGEEPQSVLSEILDFIGAEQAGTKTDLAKNVFPGEKITLPIELRSKLFTDLQPQYDFLHSLFPDDVESWVSRHKLAMS